MSAVLKPLLQAAAAPAPDLEHLDWLESEAIHIMREVVAETTHPALLFSGGKDSIVMLRIAEKAFRPDRFPFPLLHIDTEHNFPEVISFRDARAAELGERLIVRSVGESIRVGRVKLRREDESRNVHQTVTLLDAVKEFGFDALFGGARRDEEKARAKERIFSHRDATGRWNPQHQRPELWHLFNGRKNPGEHFRVFPLSNWTELDVWHYIAREKLPLPALYFAHDRDVFLRAGTLLAASKLLPLQPGERIVRERVRFRTVGDLTCTGAVRSNASSLDDIIAEVAAARQTERGTRYDDRRSDTAMEDRKRQGYF